jgi:Cu+-exporting ATPase
MMGRVKDIVCNCEIDEEKAVAHEHEGKTYHFCTPTCKATFEDNPGKYV